MSRLAFLVVAILAMSVISSGDALSKPRQRTVPTFEEVQKVGDAIHNLQGNNLDAGSLAAQGLNFAAAGHVTYETQRQLDRVRRIVPAGSQVQLTLLMQKFPAPYDGSMLSEIMPYRAPPTLSENHYETYTVTIVGTGQDLEHGAPLYAPFKQRFGSQPTISDHEHASFPDPTQGVTLNWNAYLQELDKWRAANPHPAAMYPKPEPIQADAAYLAKSGLLYSDLLGVIKDEQAAGHDTSELTRLQEMLRVAVERVVEPDSTALPPPGGISFDEASTLLASGKLSIRRVAYDPVDQTVVVQGRRSSTGIDADMLSTALRLANTSSDIYFSLDPSDKNANPLRVTRSVVDPRLPAFDRLYAVLRARGYSAS